MARPRLPENRPNAQLAQDAIDAKKLGISYGMYSAMCEMGKIKHTDVRELEQRKRKENNNGKETKTDKSEE